MQRGHRLDQLHLRELLCEQFHGRLGRRMGSGGWMNELRDPNTLIVLVLALVLAGACIGITLAGIR